MTVEKCYELLHGNYQEAKQRLMNDNLIDRFILKFPKDDSMEILKNAIESNNIAESFRGAHTLKGVAANLAFTELRDKASALTEQLRPQTSPADLKLYQEVLESYQLVLDVLSQYQAEK